MGRGRDPVATIYRGRPSTSSSRQSRSPDSTLSQRLSPNSLSTRGRTHAGAGQDSQSTPANRQTARPSAVTPRSGGSNTRSRQESQRLTGQRLDQLSQRARGGLRSGSNALGAGVSQRAVSYRRPVSGHETVVDDSYRRHHASAYRCLPGRSEPIIYRDRPGHHRPSHTYDYYDSYRRRCHRVIWPQYNCRIYYPCRSRTLVACHYPYYHRKYVFVSLGGWWPSYYDSTRYYWYGWHPYRWYGYSPVPYEVGGVYNNYTYNYYGADGTAQSSSRSAMPGSMAPAEQAVGVDPSSDGAPIAGPADHHFSAGVKAFEEGHYAMAATSFQQAMETAPGDKILPFAYAQALFADGHYRDAVSVLRLALASSESTEEAPGVFYPRGLYQDDDQLFTHIDQFMDVQESQPQDADLKLLLGYHLLGIGEVSLARSYLEDVESSPETQPAAQTLLVLADRLEAEAPAAAGN